jgi:hypothetical protein
MEKDDSMKTYSLNRNIYQLVKNDPFIEQILYDIGFVDIIKPGMIQTVGRFMTLKQGSQLKKISLEHIKNVFHKHGYHLEED